MKSCWLLLVFASALLQGQNQPGVLLPKPGTDRPQALEGSAFDWSLIPSPPQGVWNQEFQPNWAQAPGQQRFDWQLTNTQPRTVLKLEAAPRASTCVVPLLAVPVNPDTDPKMLINPPRSRSESAGIVKGLPPCRNSGWK